jgi:IPT/TIG domain-containing protein
MSKNGITEQVEDALTYPILTQPVDTQPSTDSQAVSISGGASLDSIAQSTIRRVLGWRYRAADTKGFTAALTKTFTLKEVEGHLEWEWKPQNYMVQADLGEVTGAQASIYSRAKVALDQIVPLLDGLNPLRVDADLEDCEAIRSIIRSELKDQLVPEFGQPGGPRVQLVEQVFRLLLGSNPTQDPEKVGGQFGEMRDLFGFDRNLVTNITEEVDLTNFLIVVDYVNSLYTTWNAQAKFLGRQPGAEPFLGTQLVLLSQALEVVAESVQMAYDAMDSVFFGAAERQTTFLSLNGEAPITVAELLGWVDQATVDGLQMLQDGGKFGVVVLQSTVSRLYDLVDLAWKKSKSGSDNPVRGFHTARTQRHLDEVRTNLRRVRDLAGEINAPDGQPTLRPSVTSVSPTKGPPAPTPLTISGANLSGVSQVMLVGQNSAQFVPGAIVQPVSSSQIVANFNLGNSQPGEFDFVLLTVDGLRVEFEQAFTVQAPAPVIIPPVAQTIAEQNDELLLEITGQNFQHRAVVTLTSGSLKYTGDVESLTANLIVARFSLSLIRAANNWQLVVKNPDGQQSNPPINFNIILPAPLIESFVPKFTGNNAALALTISGQYFQQGATVSLQAEGLTTLSPNMQSVQSEETINCSFILANATPGSYFVVVTNPDRQEAWSDEQLEIFDPNASQMRILPPPIINGVHARVDEKAGLLKLRVTGQNLQAGMLVTLTDQDYAVKADVVNPATLFAEFDLSIVLNGPWTLMGQNPDGQVSGTFSITPIVFPPPVVDSFIPASRIEHKDLYLTIRGQYFRSPVTVELRGQAGVSIASSQPANVINGEIVQAEFSGTDLEEGHYYIVVSNSDGQEDWSQQVLKIEAHASAKKHPSPKRRRRRPGFKASGGPVKGKPGKKPTKP